MMPKRTPKKSEKLLLLFLFPCVVCLHKSCTDLSKLSLVHVGQKLENINKIQSYIVDGLMACSRECLFQTNCLSFNFHLTSGLCELMRIEADPSTLVPSPDVAYASKVDWGKELTGSCQYTDCPPNYKCVEGSNGGTCVLTECGLPFLEYGINPLYNGTGMGCTAVFTCSGLGIHPENVSLTCSSTTGRWEGGRCRNVASCEAVKECGSDYEDGEYWLYPMIYGNRQKIKVYCFGLNTGNPQAYVSLPPGNKHFYPKYQYDHSCGLNDNFYRSGESVFTKIGLNVDTMTIRSEDYQFTQVLWGVNGEYAVAADCVQRPTQTCTQGNYGSFKINTTGTGVIIDPKTTWGFFGWGSAQNYFNRDSDQVIEIQCKGYCGGCRPESDVKLQVDNDTVLDDNMADEVSCSP
ncbi:hypothetical protein SNE40_020195 [Patella caerulea]|uniref:Uncharacterized protein n=1 Tax=Patella caerulea TaxID=87958 RepID=A0AAN8GHK7_PATCE